MNIYLAVKRFVERITGFTIYRSNIPWGFDMAKDMRRLRADWSPRIIFDVGANIGQTAQSMTAQWPDASIYSFEPVQESFRQLTDNVKSFPNVEAIQLALGATPGQLEMKIFNNSRLASFDHDVEYAGTSVGEFVGYENVTVDTIDRFCEKHGIDRLNLLKIDTEGHDLDVLHGATFLLNSQKIDFILAEVSVYRKPGKVSISDLVTFLEQHRYICVGLYEQDFWAQQLLYYGNALFVRQEFLKTDHA